MALYPHGFDDELTDELFRCPGAEYRGTPFWAWNGRPEREELFRQIGVFREMGFGGFHMHVRYGLEIPYLSEEFLHLVADCAEEAEVQGMLAWLYDEDRWPSGFGGGYVTREPRYRQQLMRFSPRPLPLHEVRDEEDPAPMRRLLARFRIRLDEQDCLGGYEMDPADEAEGDWYVYHETAEKKPRFNGQAYVDVMSREAMQCFIDTTYEAYRRAVGDRFGGVVPAIFTDEPQLHRGNVLSAPRAREEVTFPYTADLPDSFRAAYGEELIPHLPELIWNLPQGRVSRFRYRYRNHVCDRFAEAYTDLCGAWCREHGVGFTGHALMEGSLSSQTTSTGEVMRLYRGFTLPGIDMLCHHFELTTAKQCQSAVRQYGREGMLSELYGVTSWDFGFRGHKTQGDWQAACGVSIRVPHLSWMSMKGQAKRDYPAAIDDHSPWYREYRYIEDHFARVNIAMTRGEPVVRAAVLHPIESFWLHTGTVAQDGMLKETLDEQFLHTAEWLLRGGVDYDYISESLLPELCPQGGVPLRVGRMAYDVVVVPGCETLRSTTLERLEAFSAAGGRLIFMGRIPSLEEAVPSDRPARLAAAEGSVCIPFDRGSLLSALAPFRTVDIRRADGGLTDDLIYRMQRDGRELWLFIAHASDPYNRLISQAEDITIRLPGRYTAELYDTLSGTHEPIPVAQDERGTTIPRRLWMYDSLLLRLTPGEATPLPTRPPKTRLLLQTCFPQVPYTLHEPNVLLLDTAEYGLDDQPFEAEEELLRADTALRRRLGWEPWGNQALQPWVIPDEPVTHRVRLRFTVQSETDTLPLHLALEGGESATIRLNGQEVPATADGFYVDRAILTIPLPGLRQGCNLLEITLPFGRRTATEWCYLLGDFGVRVAGRVKTVIPPPPALAHGSITGQGLPFYSGKITYRYSVTTPADGRLCVRVPQYNAAVLEVAVDGGEPHIVAFAPYETELEHLPAGEHTVTVTAAINRTNTFGPVHLADETYAYPGPITWRTEGDAWSYEYHLKPEGLFKEPELAVLL